MKNEKPEALIAEAAIATVISNKTGELMEEIYPGDKVVHKKDIDKKHQYLQEVDTNFNKGVGFVKLYDGMGKKIMNYLSGSEALIAIGISDYICYEDCMLRKGGHQNGELLDINSLSEEMDKPYDTLRKTINGLIKKGVIAYCKTGCRDNPKFETKAIIVNPYIYTRGIKINKTVISLFEHSQWNDTISKEEERN